jgi:hypothetical protein
MTFTETLDKHLRAIQDRDLTALTETLPDDGDLVLIMADGRLVRTVREFIDLHRAWFASPTWALAAAPVQTLEAPGLGVAVLRLDYRDAPAGGAPIHETSYLTLVFALRGPRWVLVQDQNTPVRTPGT